jgi:hypothetical protein
MCSRERTEGQSAHPIAMSAKHSQGCHCRPTPPMRSVVAPLPPPLTKDNGLPPAINVAAATQRRVNAMEGPSSRPCRAAVSASGTRLQARLHSAQPHDATKDKTVVASPTEQYPLKPSPPPPQSRGCPNAFFIWKGGNPFLFFQDYQMWKWRVYTNQLLFRYDGGNGEGAS